MNSKVLKVLITLFVIFTIIYGFFKNPLTALVQNFIIQNNLAFLVAFLKFGLMYIAMVALVVFIADKTTNK